MGLNERLRLVGAKLILAMSEVEPIDAAEITRIEQAQTERGTTYFVVTFFDRATNQNYQIAIPKEAGKKLDMTRQYRLVVLRGDEVAHLLVCESAETGKPSDIMAEGRYIFFQEMVNYDR